MLELQPNCRVPVPSGTGVPPTFDAKNLIAVMLIKRTGVAGRAAESFQSHPDHASGLELNHFVERLESDIFLLNAVKERPRRVRLRGD